MQIKRMGFGQVEPNHLSAQRTGQIYAQLPAAADIDILENGQFVKYDYANGEVNLTGAGEWMMVFNEVKLYDGWRESYKDFAMIKDRYTPGHYTFKDADGNETDKFVSHDGLGPFPGQMTPRLFKTNVGDIYTTNCVGMANESGRAVVDGLELNVGDTLKVGDEGYLVAGEDDAMTWQVVKVYNMPDMQPAVKLMRIK